MSEKSKNDATIGFEEKIWQAADILRGNMDPDEHKHIVLGFIFLKYISDRFEDRFIELLVYDEDIDDKSAYKEVNVFYVPEDARWSLILDAKHKEAIGIVIDDVMRAIERENPRLKGVLPKNYANADLDKRGLSNVVDVFSNVRKMEYENGQDILGRAYEYCLSKFAEKEGKNEGEFYTPSCIAQTLVAVLQPFDGRIYDPCCGYGSMFIQYAYFIESIDGDIDNLSLFGQEVNATTRKIAIMNLAISGIEANLGPSNADIFNNDLHKKLKADFILANPPFNMSAWNGGLLDEDARFKYGMPPEDNANFAWLSHMIHHLSTNGKIGIVLDNSSLSSQTKGEGEIRENIIEDDLVEGIVAMPSQLFHSTQIPVCLWFLNRNKSQKGKTIFIDARKMGQMVTSSLKEITLEDIGKIAEAFLEFEEGVLEDEKGFCAVVSTEDIKKNDYILTPELYVGVEEL